MNCKRCHSYAINMTQHGRDGKSDPDLCDVCYWRHRAEDAEATLREIMALTVQKPQTTPACPTCNGLGVLFVNAWGEGTLTRAMHRVPCPNHNKPDADSGK